MKNNLIRTSVVDNIKNISACEKTLSVCSPLQSKKYEDILKYYNKLNTDSSHMISNDDICTPIECVKKMIDYIPSELWKRKNLRILDPCCGNGNFGAYCQLKTDLNKIWFYDINDLRLANCKRILNPKHIEKVNFFDLLNTKNNRFDLIMANPPYSGGGNKNQSLSNNFIEKAIDLLNDKGYLCFVTPNNWMTYNNNNTTLNKLLNTGSFVVIDNDVKKYFNGVGSSFTIFIWQKSVFSNKTDVYNGYLIHDFQQKLIIPKSLKFIPLYLSQNIINVIEKSISHEETGFCYRCDLHNFTRKDLLSDIKDNVFKYETIHTVRKTRYAKIKQDIYNKWVVIIPLSTYFIPYVKHHVNTTQSVGYYSFDSKKAAENFIKKITKPYFKVIVHLTRYGNFNNIMVLKHLYINKNIKFTNREIEEINKINALIKY